VNVGSHFSHLGKLRTLRVLFFKSPNVTKTLIPNRPNSAGAGGGYVKIRPNPVGFRAKVGAQLSISAFRANRDSMFDKMR